MFLVFLVANRFKEVLVTPRPAAVLRRAVARSSQANGSSRVSLVAFNDFFNSNLMLPAISEVIKVGNRVTDSSSQPCQTITIFTLGLINLKLGIRVAVLANNKLMISDDGGGAGS